MLYDGVSYRYRGEPADALTDLTLEVAPGGVTALLGPNGSGKSTALGLGADWLKASSGRVDRRGGAAFLPQSERLAFSFSCLEYVCFGRAPHLPYLAVPGDGDRDKALAALAAVGMEAKASRLITAISGGELQLVRIARALAQEAPFAILDEPTDMLDPAHVASVAAVLRRLAASGVGILLSTHDLAFALAVADRAALLKGGRLLRAGPTAEVLTCDGLSELYGTPFRMVPVPVPGEKKESVVSSQ